MSETPQRSLDVIRMEIDKIDTNLVKLLSNRVELAQEVGKVKGRDGRPFYTPEREKAIFEKLARDNPGPLLPGQLKAIFREIISAARAAEKPLRVGYWGPPGTFTNLAAIETFGNSSEYVGEESIEEVFLAVEHGRCDYGVVPVENSVAGVVPETLDMFPWTNVKICAETHLAIHHHLASQATSLDQVKRVYAGPQPATQCKRWLREHLPKAEILEVVPTAKAAQRASQDPEGAAIANRLGAEMAGLSILREHIEDNPKNRTRFLVIGYNEPSKTGRDKTSVLFNLRNKPGELVKALQAFEVNGVNLLMIESRPSQRASFEYLFYCDCEGHRTDPAMQQAIETLRVSALETIVLGSYPTQNSTNL